VLLLVATALLPASDLSGQTSRTWGITAGQVSARQIWSGPAETDYRTGIVVGAFLDVGIPIPGLSVRSELLYAQRGTLASDPQGEGFPEGRVRSHCLTFPLHLKASHSIGPLSAYLTGGPTFEQIISTTTDGEVGSVITEERPTVVNVSIGGGVAVRLPRSLVADVEVRLTEALGDAYAGRFVTMRSRSVEVLGRLGVRR
jgi:hypothetical protein